ncbi:o-succinylbenzoate synthase [Pareuzebyella sediminis]|uniref:o-succinylbenzoate synthase n=1 Tax=Pareuzebyella sediminis TaxID=2607998 RepID=UPI0011EEAEB2|nr:o-succinylbenzoate synthase [Pareuzebyella sediminis]
MKAFYKKYILNFKRPSGTSRGVLTEKETWFLILEANGRYGIGECGLLRTLSIDDVESYEEQLKWTCNHIDLGKHELLKRLTTYPSIQFGIEQAFLSLASPDPFVLFPSEFVSANSPVSINGLIWMGDEGFMHRQIIQKLKEGFRCIKMKIGAIDFDTEVALLASIRKKYSEDEIELRVDANGAFEPSNALEKLKVLSKFGIHSIEQPIKSGQTTEMAKLCRVSPLPIALDEELIGVLDVAKKRALLQNIRPHYIILKPSLIGGYKGSSEWIRIAEELKVKWWVTSALESNIGLNAIAQWTYTLQSEMPQGLGTGGLYTNNFKSPLTVADGKLYYNAKKHWKNKLIENLCT